MKTIIIKKNNVDDEYKKLIFSLDKFCIQYKTLTLDDKVEDKDIDFIIALGGDGTILKASKNALNIKKPVFGINAGGLGFLSSVNKNDDFDEYIKRIIDKKFFIENRETLEVNVNRDGQSILNDIIINEIEISANRKSHVGKFHLYIDDEKSLLNEFSADGILISTPTGASGYSFSAFAPIVSPDAKNIIITPIYPHAFNQRPFVLNNDKKVILNLDINFADLLLDGKDATQLMKNDKVIVNKSSKTFGLIYFEKNYFFDNLRDRMKTL